MSCFSVDLLGKHEQVPKDFLTNRSRDREISGQNATGWVGTDPCPGARVPFVLCRFIKAMRNMSLGVPLSLWGRVLLSKRRAVHCYGNFRRKHAFSTGRTRKVCNHCLTVVLTRYPSWLHN